AIVLVIFGASRVPEVGRAMGKGIREFRSAVTGGKDEEPKDESASEDKSEATSEKS
ncbi:MAG: twin-arginine translocase TatA/TatE family subunit, partial [Chloroflexi bacterium]|nr:twin-arginine translocase TatA/TatE family subunit [Chloroflexota bacterium]